MGVCWVWGSLMVLLAGGKCWVSGHQPGKGGTWVKGMKERLWDTHSAPPQGREPDTGDWGSRLFSSGRLPPAPGTAPSAPPLFIWGLLQSGVGSKSAKWGPALGSCDSGPAGVEGQRGRLEPSSFQAVPRLRPGCWRLREAAEGTPAFFFDQIRNLSSNAAREALFTLPQAPPGRRPPPRAPSSGLESAPPTSRTT